MKKSVLVVLIIFLGFQCLLSNDVDDFENGYVDCEGDAEIGANFDTKEKNIRNAIVAAKKQAITNLVAFFEGINITSATTVKDLKLSKDIILSKIEGSASLYEFIGEPDIQESEKSVTVNIRGYLKEEAIKNKILTATGFGIGSSKIRAKKAAIADARRELMEKLKKIEVFSREVIKEGEHEVDVIHTLASGTIRYAKELNNSLIYIGNNFAQITYYIQLEDFSETVPTVNYIALKDEKFADDNMAIDGSYDELNKKMSSGVYTGLIIDCSNFRIQPAIAPKIYNENNKEVYGSLNVIKGYAVKEGMVGYTKSVDKAKNNPRVGSNPLVIEGKPIPSKKCDVVISNSDASKIDRLMGSQFNFLRECRVMIVTK